MRLRRAGPRFSPFARAAVLLAGLSLLASGALAAGPWESRDGTRWRIDGTDASVADASALVLQVWPSPGLEIARVGASVGGVALPDARWLPGAGGVAFLFLVDTSDPRREAVVRRNAGQIAEFAAAAAPEVAIGVAAFDTELHLLHPVDADREGLAAGLAGLRAAGQTTQLYRHTLGAIDLVAETGADRPAVVVMSDGADEDTAWSHADVVARALQQGVVVHGLGYAPSAAQARYLQTLIRMAGDTGGIYLAADGGQTLPADFAGRMLAATTAGGRAEIDLGPAIVAGLEGPQPATVTLYPAAGPAVVIGVSVTLPAIGLGGRLAAPGNRNLVLAASGGVFLAVVLAVLLIARRRGRRPAGPATPLAWVELFDDIETRCPMTGPVLRLGREADNDLCLNNRSVSAWHAEIKQRRDGSFVIADLDSLNGVVINDEQVDLGRLFDGDIVDLGEVRFRFRLNPEWKHA